MKILSEDERYSTRIIRRLAAETLRIPETDEALDKTAGEKTAEDECDCCECPEGNCKCGCRCANHTAKTAAAGTVKTCESCGAQNPSNIKVCASCAARLATDGCPNCGQELHKIANIRRCVCGFATTAEKPAGETGVAEYYRKIFPDAFVSEMTGDPKSIDDKNVCYDVEKSETKKISSQAIRHRRARERKRAEGLEGAGQTDVPDAHPESSAGAGSGSDKPKAKMITEDSANSVSGPNKAESHGPGSGKNYPKTDAPDLGEGKHKSSRRKPFPRVAEHPAGSPTKMEDPSPQSGASAGSGATATPDPSWQSGDSANSISGPEKASGHGAGLQDPGAVSAPDLGLPRGAKRAAKHPDGCGCGFCKAIKSKSEGEGDSDGGKAEDKDAAKWITRKVMATLCPPCAEEMARRGIKQIRADVIAKMIADRADKKGFTVKASKVAVAPPGRETEVKHLKDEPGVDNPFALSWWKKEKGYKPHTQSSPHTKQK